ncbi:MAG: carbonic anhydrase [Alphaproteobacteria bacterium]|nr:carbonic anhydrase [Alphaproteobacteria bacterium]
MQKTNKLLAGFRVFRATYFEQRPELFEGLTRKGQRPQLLVIACSDSRVDPAILFNAEPGELFVVRNVANLVPPYQPDGHYHGTSAALEFAVRDLGVSDIVVLGHSQCGGIHALCEAARGRPVDREFITPWISLAACEGGGHAAHDERHVEQAGIMRSIENLRSFPWIAERETAGEIALHGWWFDLERGALSALDHEAGSFNVVEPA